MHNGWSDGEARLEHPVTKTAHAFKLGEFQCAVISDGRWDYPIEKFFPSESLPEAVERLRSGGLPLGRVTMQFSGLTVNTAQNRVLIDGGANRMVSDDDPESRLGMLQVNLGEAGIDAAQIDSVIITHAHGDHIGGLVQEGRLAYPNARYYISRVEWAYWMSEASVGQPDHLVQTARTGLSAIQGRVEYFEPDGEILPGFSALSADGHTPGHTVVEVSSNGQRLLCISDLALLPLHIERPDLIPDYFDTDRRLAERSKQRVFSYAKDAGLLVYSPHLAPFPGLGHVVAADAGWRWEPLDPGHGVP